MRQRLLYLMLLALLVLPAGALAHDESGAPDEFVEPRPGSDPEMAPPGSGYTGPGREPYISFFQGSWLYGTAAATPLGDQHPRDIRGAGDWLVWEDANRGDIYAYNIPAGNGLYITTDRALQRSPDISGNVVVYEDYRHGAANIYAYFLDTAETRRISNGTGHHRNPSVYGTLVTWEDDRSSTRDVWAARLDGTPAFPIATTADRESDPLALDEVVYFRTYRFGVWDIFAHDLRANETFEVTSDTKINGAPFTNGRDVFFLSQFHTSWQLDRYDVRRDRMYETALRFSDTSRKTVEGDRLIDIARDLGGQVQLVARNLSSGNNNHISGNLYLASDPHLQDGVVYAAARTANGTALLALKVSEFAWGPAPKLTITSPGSIAPWVRPVNVVGILSTGPGWAEPATFTVTINGGAPQVVTPAETWRVTLDPKGYDPGVYRVLIRATFREGPPVATGLSLIVPAPFDTVDVEEAGPAYHAARVMQTFNQYIGQNPAAYFLIPLLLILAVLVAIRLWIRWRGRKETPVAEYVAQE